ncbi:MULTISPECIES: MarR family transcriptional regulator [unclassified Curtobacterium]|uniref:MarR family winged helix-turn-helix transcriptional regulator n=1 Tax=unclassified Curtobacterium TaxID=257496 RepID=UPI000D8D89A7|nr:MULTISPECIES: MarR family transcriptional regulator [unclassified Curtobacterium]PYY65188.1 MarR family transcriptional regulator [Curtobacterium sp. MCPF17_003]PZE70816.1 MarR family transcriptional regulator [Curtobacterium sp. MCPF17_018]PZF33558.1 MarR family transcriptional regulator [Curtobacterium sp. MCPF17_051]WIB71930.1 MarR family transcriptional regulator [Curtobacterium sp. MCBD17_026]
MDSPTPTDALPEIDWGAEGIESELGWALPLAFQGFTRLGSEAVADVPGGPRGYQVLVAITTEEASSQLGLAQRLGIDKTQMTYIVDALEAGGFVERRPAPTDRRVRQVHPTDAGRALLARARSALREAEGVLMRHLDDDERTTMRRLLARVALTAGTTTPGPSTADPTFHHPLAVPERSRRHTTTTSSTPTE